MRKIKFRAFEKSSKTMWFWQIDYDIGIQRLFSNGDIEVAFPVQVNEYGEAELNLKRILKEDLILMQFTGLKDKNGKEIYEGDIVKIFAYDAERKATIEYDKNCFCIIGLDKIGNSGFSFFLGMWKDDIEIIGNIFEHPELLEGK